MSLYRFIFSSFIVTLIMIGYVHQRVEIVKAEYRLQENRKYLNSLVDQNLKLRYNLSKMESPKYLLASLSREDVEFSKMRTRQVDSYQLERIDSAQGAASAGIIGKFFDLFTPSVEARSRECE